MSNMPNKAPERTEASLGPSKIDIVPPPNPREYVSAKEWNAVCDELIATAELVLKIDKRTYNQGTLQAAYDAAPKAPNAINFSDVLGGLILRDSTAGVGTPLLQITNDDGKKVFLEVAADHFSLAAVNGSGLKGDPLAGVRLARDTDAWMPASDGTGALGSEKEMFGRAYVRATGTRTVIAPPKSGALEFDARGGSIQVSRITENIQDLAITGGIAGQELCIVLVQDTVGDRIFDPAGRVRNNIRTKDGRPRLPLSYAPQSKSWFWFYCDGPTYIEKARYLELDPESRYQVHDLGTAPEDVEIKSLISGHTHMFMGVNKGPSSVNFPTLEAIEGDKYQLDFQSLKTSSSAPFEVRSGGTPILTYKLSRTLSGILICTFDGSDWRIGDATVYT